ncbi:putative non-specific serine/threonine protein kinase [Helianthus annuus]|nr:putative non-specific serine/threonine protein kinase [Helianthus annuus]
MECDWFVSFVLNKTLIELLVVSWGYYELENSFKVSRRGKTVLRGKDLICKLLCNVEKRLGTKGAHEIKAHPWFKGIEWEKLYQMEAAFIPEVNGELDTQNFEKFEEGENQIPSTTKSGPWRKVSDNLCYKLLF